jgi:hypothetical protein
MAVAMSVIGAAASLLRGGKYVHTEIVEPAESDTASVR